MNNASPPSISDILGVIGVIVGIISIVFAYYFYRISLHERKPTYSMETNTLIQGTSSMIGGLEVLYGGKKVENLSVSLVMFWNDGKETITQANVRAAEPIRIEAVGDAAILHTELLEANYPANQLAIHRDPDGSKAIINFADLDYEQGGLFQVVHTGTSSDALIVRGSVHGSAKIELKIHRTDLTGSLRVVNGLMNIVIGVNMSITVLALGTSLIQDGFNSFRNIRFLWVNVAVFAIFGITYFILHSLHVSLENKKCLGTSSITATSANNVPVATNSPVAALTLPTLSNFTPRLPLSPCSYPFTKRRRVAVHPRTCVTGGKYHGRGVAVRQFGRTVVVFDATGAVLLFDALFFGSAFVLVHRSPLVTDARRASRSRARASSCAAIRSYNRAYVAWCIFGGFGGGIVMPATRLTLVPPRRATNLLICRSCRRSSPSRCAAFV